MLRRWPGRVVRSVALLSAALACVRPARGQEVPPGGVDARPKAPRLSYKQGPAQCLPEDLFRAEVAIALDGGDYFDDTAPDVVRVWFEKIPGGYRGTVEYTDAKGHKDPWIVKTGPLCETLGRWVGGAASDYIPPHLWRKAPAEPAPCPVCVPSKPAAWVPPVLPPQRLDHPSPRRPEDMDVTIGLSGLALMTAGLTADAGPGFGIMADVRGEVISLGLELRGVLPARTVASNPIPGKVKNGDAEFDLSQWTALLVPCARWKFLVGCGVAQAGVFNWKNRFEEGTLPVLSFGPRVGLDIPLGDQFGVFGFAEALFAASQAGLDFDRPGTPDGTPKNAEWTQSIVSGFFGVGASVRFQ